MPGAHMPSDVWDAVGHVCCRVRKQFPLSRANQNQGGIIHGQPGISRRSGPTRMDANDNVHVAKVRVTISNEEGNTLEQGDAARVNDARWKYETDVAV